MNFSPNLDKKYSQSTKTKYISKYGMDIELNLLVETRTEWVLVFRDKETNEKLSTEEAEAYLGTGKEMHIGWEPTDNAIEMCSTKSVFLYDDEHGGERQYPIVMATVADGPLLGTVVREETDGITLQDPCYIAWDKDQRIKLLPIFGAERRIFLYQSSIKVSSHPPEVLLDAYLGFVVQNRMCKYQLRPRTPFSTSPPLSTLSDNYDKLVE